MIEGKEEALCMSVFIFIFDCLGKYSGNYFLANYQRTGSWL